MTSFRRGNTTMGHVKHVGTHLVRIIKEGESVTFHVDPDNDGPTDDDLELTVPNIKALAPFLNSKNSNLFFKGGGTFLSARMVE